jgi:tRNA A-37 threonylcarbamoyl transferase component Bud32
VVREWQTAEDFRAFGIGTAEPICLGVDQSRGSRGLLVTKALDEYESLEDVLKRLPGGSETRQRLWYRIADDVLRIHEQGYRHNCLYGQHILVRETDGDWHCAFIDLEKATRTRRQDRAAIADLSALDRHTNDMSLRDREWFWDRYFCSVPLPERAKILKVLTRRTAERAVGRYIGDCEAGRRGDAARGPTT